MPTSPCALALLLVALLAAVTVVRGEPHNTSSWLLPAPFASKRRFTQDKLIDAGDLNLAPTAGGPIAAWLDWNGDQHVDLVRLSADQRSLAVHLWDSAQFQFNSEAVQRLELDLRVIKSVVPGDYNFDGKIDLLLLGSLHTGGGWWGGDDDDQEDRTEMRVHLQQPDGSIGPAIRITDAASLAHPIPFDGTGDMRTDVIGFARASGKEEPDVLRMWRNVVDPANNDGNGNETDSSSLFSLVDAPLDYSSHPSGQFTCHFPSPHFNAFIDLDGDCLADLFFVCLGGGKRGHDPERLEYQVWTNTKGGGEGKGKFVFKREGTLPRGTKSVTFGDMDRDGTIDLVVTSCPKSTNHHQQRADCQISILYNRQIPLCDSSSSSSSAGGGGACRDPEALCTADPDFGFTTPDEDETTIIRVEDLAPSSSSGGGGRQQKRRRRRLVTHSAAGFKGSFPLLASVGDFNIDGYPDLLIVTADEHNPKDKRAQILESVPCSGGGGVRGGLDGGGGGAIAGCGGGGGGGSGGGDGRRRGRRGFRLVTNGAEALEQIDDVESAHWVDIDDDGTLDILVQRTGGDGSSGGAARHPVFIKNNYFHDAFFLKAQVLNGACQGWCEPRQGTDEQRYRPFGSSYSGASFKFTVLDPTGARRSTQFAQLPQSSYMSLSTPYAYCGLGRTNNYVENLFVGSTRDQPQHFINVEGIIPNSQILINPYQPGGVDEPSGWTKTLYLRPGDWIPWVTVVLLAAILGLGIVVIVLHLREKREDEAERRARLLSLNFQAL